MARHHFEMGVFATRRWLVGFGRPGAILKATKRALKRPWLSQNIT